MLLDDTDDPVVLVCGSDASLGAAVAREVAERGARLALYPDHGGDALSDDLANDLSGADTEVYRVAGANGASDAAPCVRSAPRAPVQRTLYHYNRLDALVNVCMPDPQHPAALTRYGSALLDRCHAAADAMSDSAPPNEKRTNGAPPTEPPARTIVNHCFLPSLFAGTSLDSPLMVLHRTVHATTETICVEHGRSGVRANTVLTGLFDVPEVSGAVPPSVREASVPVGRWGDPDDFAKTVSFLTLENDYVSGRSFVLDGGLTTTR